MKKLFKVFACVCLALVLASCDSAEETKKELDNKLAQVDAINKKNMASPRKVGLLSNGQVLYQVEIEYYQPYSSNDTHYVYYTDGGKSVSDNHKTNDKYRKNLTEVSLSGNRVTAPSKQRVLLPADASEEDILKAAEKIKADKDLQKEQDMKEYLRLKSKLNIQ